MSTRHELRQAEEAGTGRFSTLITEAEALGQALPVEAIPEALGQLERAKARFTARLVSAAARETKRQSPKTAP